MGASRSMRSWVLVLDLPVQLILIILSFSIVSAAQNCSASNPCSTGCCSKYGYCGTGSSFCGADVCVDTCDYTAVNQCDATKLCAIGCCSKFGVCGLGPDYCSKENCVSTCDAKSECDPDNWGLDYATSETCPLNVCCSKYGFCGTTAEFCGDEKVKRPSCSTTQTLPRVVGYYEGWSTQRPCDGFYPEQIPMGIYTHLIYAFASINPQTFEVVPATQDDASLYSRITALKNKDPDLHVNIGIGGWSFNDPGPTATTFSDLVGSEDNQRIFFKSLISFMATYNFDGVDIDWEYPAADDRSGRPEDFANFPKFMSNLKVALKSTGGRDELSMTLPTSYWYLQHFDIKNLEPSVDFFNYMAYDLHGTWDKGNKWTGAYLDAHTNLTEITTDLDLLWRNNISPDKVVLGMAFYGRGFTVSDTNCMTPGCTFQSGSVAGNCSLTAGILIYSEIDTLMRQQNVNPKYDKDAAVAILSWGDQWIAYDNIRTFGQKITFARTQCLGGVMIWAVSQDDASGLTQGQQSLTIRNDISIRPFTSYTYNVNNNDPSNPTITITTPHKQCKWTGCGEVCPSGYVAVSRTDSDARDGELMLDGTGCGGKGVHTFCCPSDETLPQCGWYQFNNGNCGVKDGWTQCPGNMLEVGSNNQYCHNRGYEGACCTYDVNSMQVYNSVEWSKWPACDSGECPWQNASDTNFLVSSHTGSGGALCYVGSWTPRTGSLTYQQRKLCYNPDAVALGSCAWANNGDSQCSSTCPQSQVRLALDTLPDGCRNGANAYCCQADYSTSTTSENPTLTEFKTDLPQFLAYGYCPVISNPLTLKKRATTDAEYLNYLAWTIAPLLVTADPLTALGQAIADYWNQVMGKLYPKLTMKNVQVLYSSNLAFQALGEYYAAVDVLCRPGIYEDLVANIVPDACTGDDLCEYDPEVCAVDDNLDTTSGTEGTGLAKRAPSGYPVWCAAKGTELTAPSLKAASYPPQGKWPQMSKQNFMAKQIAFPGDCADPTINTQLKRSDVQYQTEHIIELQLIPMFIYTVTSGRLLSGASGSFNPADCYVFLSSSLGGSNFMGKAPSTLPDKESYPGGVTKGTNGARLMAALGSQQNTANFWLLQEEVNGLKGRIFRNVAIRDDDKWIKERDDTANPGTATKLIRHTIAVWNYLNDPQIHQSMVNIANNVLAELEVIQTAWKEEYGEQLELTDAWREFFPDVLQFQATRTLNWVNQKLQELEQVWIQQPNTNPDKAGVLANIWKLRNAAITSIRADTSGLPQRGT